jgi:hypothetical protein
MTTSTRARLLAVEVLLDDPEELGNDALEGDLYILRDRLRATLDAPDQARKAKFLADEYDQEDN